MVRRVGRNEPCPCGSGRKYKRCCYPLPVSECVDKYLEKERNKLIPIMVKKNNLSFCIYPKKDECRGNIIKAHSVSKSAVLKSIARDSKVVHIRINWVKDDIVEIQLEAVFDEIGIHDASTFTGFCEHHDNKLFIRIDDEEYCEGDLEQEFLFTYRSYAREYFGKLLQHKKAKDASQHIDSQLEWTSQYSVFSPTLQAEKEFNQKYLKDIESGLDDIRHLQDAFHRILDCEGYEELVTSSFTLDGERKLAVSGFFTPNFTFSGNFIQVDKEERWGYIALNIFPQSGKTFIIFSYLKEEKRFNRLLDEIGEMYGSTKFENAISTLIAVHLENFYISPVLFESFSKVEIEEFKTKFINTTGKLRSDDLKNLMQINLFKGFNGNRKTPDEA